MQRKHRKQRSLLLATGPLLLAAALTAPRANAAAPSPGECIAQFESVLPLRKAGKLVEARTHLQACGDPACPVEVREECVKQRDAVNITLASVIFEASDSAGNVVPTVAVVLDGETLPRSLENSELDLDPGEHTVTMAALGAPPVTKKFSLRPGEKRHHEAVLVVVVAPSAPRAPVAFVAPEKPAKRGLGAQKIVALAASGAGVVALGVGGAFGAIALSRTSTQKQECESATNCSAYAEATSEHSRAASAATISTIGVAAGLVGLGAGAVLWFATPRDRETGATQASVRVAPSVGRGVGGVTVFGEF